MNNYIYLYIFYLRFNFHGRFDRLTGGNVSCRNLIATNVGSWSRAVLCKSGCSTPRSVSEACKLVASKGG